MPDSLVFDTPGIGRVPRAAAEVRMFCFPFPGAGASAYLSWADQLPTEVELCAVQLAGREDRFREPLETSLRFLVPPLVTAIEPWSGEPFVFFGHSGGALLAYEVARALRSTCGVEPVRLIVSAEPAPDAPRTKPVVHRMPDRDFLRNLRALEGTPPEVLQHKEILELLLPVLRADFAWYESYVFEPGPPMQCPITGFAGSRDAQVSAAEVEGWRRHTVGEFELQVFDGGHFFLRDAQPAVIGAIGAQLR